LPPGKQTVTIITSGGESVLSNAIEIVQKTGSPAARAPVITDVSPKHGFLYSPTVLGISGSNFDGTIPCWSGARYVTVGGRACEFKALSDTILAVTVPAWSKVGSTNDVAMATNKLDVVVFSINGVATLTNAVSFDLTLPSDTKYSSPLTPGEDKIRKMLDAVFYAARVTGSNPVLQTSIKVTASAGDPDKSADKVSVSLPNIAASIAIGSNAAPTTAAPVKPTPTPTNFPSSSP
jgi:hypothetical protein